MQKNNVGCKNAAMLQSNAVKKISKKKWYKRSSAPMIIIKKLK